MPPVHAIGQTQRHTIPAETFVHPDFLMPLKSAVVATMMIALMLAEPLHIRLLQKQFEPISREQLIAQVG